MDNQEDHENEILLGTPSSYSSSPSSSSSSSSSSPSHTQSFASSPSSQKELSAPSTSGSSSSSSSPFSERSSPVHATVNEASTSLSAAETSDAVTVEDAAAYHTNECASFPGTSNRDDALDQANVDGSSMAGSIVGEPTGHDAIWCGNYCDSAFTRDDSTCETIVDKEFNEQTSSYVHETGTEQINDGHETGAEQFFLVPSNESLNQMHQVSLDSSGTYDDKVSSSSRSNSYQSMRLSALRNHIQTDGNGENVLLKNEIDDVSQNHYVSLADSGKEGSEFSTSYGNMESNLQMNGACSCPEINEFGGMGKANFDASSQEIKLNTAFGQSSLDAQCRENKPTEVHELKIVNSILAGKINKTDLNNQDSLKEEYGNTMSTLKAENGTKTSLLMEAEKTMCATSTDCSIDQVKNTGDAANNILQSSCSHKIDTSTCHSIDHLKIRGDAADNILQNGCSGEVETSSQNCCSGEVETTFTTAPESGSQSSRNVVASNSSFIDDFSRLNSPAYALSELDGKNQNHEDASSDVNSLHRAQTMPMGSFEVVDGIVCPSKQSSLRRSSTDKWKGGRHSFGRSPRFLEKKQKKLVRRICTIQKDGTVEFDVGKTAGLPELFHADQLEDDSQEGQGSDIRDTPKLDIVMLIVGTRGDVQPFVAIGKRLKDAHGHRVRLATHANFEEFVLKSGLEFYPLGGDPKVLAGYMVKNKGFLPSGPLEIKTQRKQLKSIIDSLLPACLSPYKDSSPFKAQAIIANPPAYGHVHVAQCLKVPLHIFFTMPWTPTSEFAHPLSRVPHSAANRISYQVVDSLIWVGIRGLINDFRKKKLKLRPVTYLGGSHLSLSKLPTGYIWSPHLVPKPKDWGSKIDVVGFCFLNLCQDYIPPPPLVQWLAQGTPPIYVGFGSLPVEDPEGMTKIILQALEETSQRGIIDKGWGGIGTMVDLPDSVYLLDNCPHDWLFPHCAAVVHHGGAGTTAAGLRAACPTTIVPFFGDQPFWGERVHAKGVGPLPIPVDHFSLEKLVSAITYMLKPEVKEQAVILAEAIKGEDGVEGAVKAFHKRLPPKMPSEVDQEIPELPPKICYGPLSCFFE